MQDYKEIFKLSNMDAVIALYDSIPADKLPIRIKAVCDYLRDGYKYAANVKDERVKKWDITRPTDIMHTLFIMATEMNKPEENLGFTIRLDSGHQISLAPFLDLCELWVEAEWIDLVDDLDELRNVLSNYLNESNVWAYKECVDTVNLLHEMFHNLNICVQNA